jgi:rare lipoprotein A
MNKKILSCLIILTSLLASCHHKLIPAAVNNNSSFSTNGKLITETGKASFYGNEFDGRKTANGETFHQSQLTAAHKHLPFGTMVKVTNLANNKTVVVRINDRGPYAAGRIIDLSKAAAKQIDMIAAGIARVKIEFRKK